MRKHQATLLDAVAANTTGTALDVATLRLHTVCITWSGVTAGATHEIQYKDNEGAWIPIDRQVITNAPPFAASGTLVIQWEGAFGEIRAVLSARTDGTFTTTYDGG